MAAYRISRFGPFYVSRDRTCVRLMNRDPVVPPMNEPFIETRYRTDCYHCRQITDQIITAVPYRAQTAGRPGSLYPGSKTLSSRRICEDREVSGLGELVETAECRNCWFAHFYKFDLEYMATEELKGR